MPWADDGRAGTMFLLAVAAATLYAASRTAAAALAGRGADRPGWRAVGHWLPIAVTALVAAGRGRPDIAVALTFATSVGCLSFVLGILIYLAPMDELPDSRRGWPFVLPAALLALIAGFSGQVNLVHAGAMLVLGASLASVWRDPAAREAGAPPGPFAGGGADAAAGRAWVGLAELLISVGLAAVGGWYAVNGTVRAATAARVFPAATLTAVILSPLVTLPMLNPGPADTPGKQTASTASTLVAVALLNLCALLPMLALLWYFKTAFFGAPDAAATPGLTLATPGGSATPSLASMMGGGRPLPYPLATWRVDSVVMTVLGFVLVPVSLGRWELRRAEGVGLVAGYAIYLVLVAFASVRL